LHDAKELARLSNFWNIQGKFRMHSLFDPMAAKAYLALDCLDFISHAPIFVLEFGDSST